MNQDETEKFHHLFQENWPYTYLYAIFCDLKHLPVESLKASFTEIPALLNEVIFHFTLINSTNYQDEKKTTQIIYLLILDVMVSNRLRCIGEEKTGILNSMFYDCFLRIINPKTTAQIFRKYRPGYLEYGKRT